MVRRVLRLDKSCTKAIIREQRLHTRQRIGRGAFTVVYDGDTPDTVWKLTADPVQRESALFYFRSPNFPVLHQDIGHVGDQHDRHEDDIPLWLYQAERLTPLRESPDSVRKEARRFMAVYNRLHDINYQKDGCFVGRPDYAKRMMALLLAEESLAQYHEAFAQLDRMIQDYQEIRLDFQPANLMARGNTLVLNDVICGGPI